jgi:hypothetical protein
MVVQEGLHYSYLDGTEDIMWDNSDLGCPDLTELQVVYSVT